MPDFLGEIAVLSCIRRFYLQHFKYRFNLYGNGISGKSSIRAKISSRPYLRFCMLCMIDWPNQRIVGTFGMSFRDKFSYDFYFAVLFIIILSSINDFILLKDKVP